jgi:hypothetical protein
MDSETQLVIIHRVAILLSRLGGLNVSLLRFQEHLSLNEKILYELETFRYAIKDAQNRLYPHWDDLREANRANKISVIDFAQLKHNYEIGCTVWHTHLANSLNLLSKGVSMDDFCQNLFEILERCVRFKFEPFPVINDYQ